MTLSTQKVPSWQYPDCSDQQKASQRENFALFQLKGMLSNLNSPVVRSAMTHVDWLVLQSGINKAISKVIAEQNERMAKAGTKRRIPKIDFSDMDD